MFGDTFLTFGSALSLVDAREGIRPMEINKTVIESDVV